MSLEASTQSSACYEKCGGGPANRYVNDSIWYNGQLCSAGGWRRTSPPKSSEDTRGSVTLRQARRGFHPPRRRCEELHMIPLALKIGRSGPAPRRCSVNTALLNNSFIFCNKHYLNILWHYIQTMRYIHHNKKNSSSSETSFKTIARVSYPTLP